MQVPGRGCLLFNQLEQEGTDTLLIVTAVGHPHRRTADKAYVEVVTAEAVDVIQKRPQISKQGGDTSGDERYCLRTVQREKIRFI